MQKKNYQDTTFQISKTVAAGDNNIAVQFDSTSISRDSGSLLHRCVGGIWHLNKENKIDRVWAVVTPNISH